MVQDEVADRLAAKPGSKIYGVPSVKAAWYSQMRKAGVIGMNVFWPAPKIASGLVEFTRHEPPETGATRKEVFAVIDAAFAQRRLPSTITPRCCGSSATGMVSRRKDRADKRVARRRTARTARSQSSRGASRHIAATTCSAVTQASG